MEKMKRGTIVGFEGSFESGIAFLKIKDSKGIHSIPVENAPTVRALDDAFGGVISLGHTVNLEAIKGKRIAYSLEPWGVMSSFVPIGKLKKVI